MTDEGVFGSTVAGRLFGKKGQVDHLKAPFLIRNASQIYLAGTLPEEAIGRLLPSGLTAASGNLCIAAFLDGPEGWEITPFRGFYCGVVVEGHDAPDGTPGVFMVAGSYSGKAGTHLKSQVSAAFETEGASFQRNGRSAVAGVRLAHGRVDVRVRAASTETHFLSGTRLYLGLDHSSQLRVWTVAYSTPYHVVEVEHLNLELSGHLAGLRNFKVDWAALCFEKTMTFGEPYFASALGERITAQTGLLNVVFSKLGVTRQAELASLLARLL